MKTKVEPSAIPGIRPASTIVRENEREAPDDRMAMTAASFDLNRELEILRAEPSWQAGHRNAKTLFKKTNLTVVLLALKAGASLEKHEAPGPITIHALAGRLRVHMADQLAELTAGGILSLDKGLTHDLEAVVESAILLTVAGAS